MTRRENCEFNDKKKKKRTNKQYCKEFLVNDNQNLLNGLLWKYYFLFMGNEKKECICVHSLPIVEYYYFRSIFIYSYMLYVSAIVYDVLCLSVYVLYAVICAHIIRLNMRELCTNVCNERLYCVMWEYIIVFDNE